MRTHAIGAVVLALFAVAAAVVSGPAVAGTTVVDRSQDADEIIRVSVPIFTPPNGEASPWFEPPYRVHAEAPTVDRRPPALQNVYLGENVTAVSLRLENDFVVERGFAVIGGIANSGTVDLDAIIARFFVGGPDYGIQIGEDILIPHLAAGETRSFSVSWSGAGGSYTLHLLVDADESIAEEDETDNIDTLDVTLIDNVPWLSQIVNGYCNYAGLSMLFNFYGAGNTVYETVEFASCPYSPVYLDDTFYFLGGIMSCQSVNDYDFAGEMRNLECSLDVRPTWALYLSDLESRIGQGTPFETGVDPYYLPQPDYDILRTLDLHSGHAIVVTGYTDSSVVVNDPGVGLEFLGQPPIPDSELRGADVVVDLATFRSAVELTLGTPRVLISYLPTGPMPSRDVMLWQAVEKSIARLDGDLSVYDDGLVYGWPPGWQPTFGRNAFETAGADMIQATFEARFWEVAGETGGDLVATLNALAAQFADGMFWHQISWDASEAFYETIGSPEAANLTVLSAALSDEGESAWTTYIQMLEAIYGVGGNPSVAEPYLAQLATDLGEIVVLEDAVRENLVDLLATGVVEDASGDEALRSPIVCAPNPFRGSTEIHFLRDGSSAGAVRIYDVAGRLVRELRPSDAAVGVESLTWSGHGTAGNNAAPGVYFVRDSCGYTTKVVKLE